MERRGSSLSRALGRAGGATPRASPRAAPRSGGKAALAVARRQRRQARLLAPWRRPLHPKMPRGEGAAAMAQEAALLPSSAARRLPARGCSSFRPARRRPSLRRPPCAAGPLGRGRTSKARRRGRGLLTVGRRSASRTTSTSGLRVRVAPVLLQLRQTPSPPVASSGASRLSASVSHEGVAAAYSSRGRPQSSPRYSGLATTRHAMMAALSDGGRALGAPAAAAAAAASAAAASAAAVDADGDQLGGSSRGGEGRCDSCGGSRGGDERGEGRLHRELSRVGVAGCDRLQRWQ